MIIPEKYKKNKSEDWLDGFRAGMKFINEITYEAGSEALNEMEAQMDARFREWEKTL